MRMIRLDGRRTKQTHGSPEKARPRSNRAKRMERGGQRSAPPSLEYSGRAARFESGGAASHGHRTPYASRKTFASRAVPLILGALLAASFSVLADSTTNKETAKPERWFQYTNDVIDNVPWSIHIVKLERASRDFEFITTSGAGTVFGMNTVSEQIKTLAREVGQPMAAVNGDFYDKNEKYQGRPRDLQIRRGEVLSNPAGHTCFWLDRDGTPHMTNVYSRFRVIWPDGKETPIGLNEAREDGTAVLYTSALGSSSRTTGGTELILEQTNGPWLPLRIGQRYSARIREVRGSGDSAIAPGLLVLSLGPALVPRLTPLHQGASVQILTETLPALSGIETAIGGGPALVHEGKPLQWKGFIHMRHPRTALGWNKDHFFLVEVDGRQSNISVGMTFPELAEYLAKIGCQEAMNFDGGGSATLWALGSVRNSPSEGDERPSANALVIVRKRPTQN